MRETRVLTTLATTLAALAAGALVTAAPPAGATATTATTTALASSANPSTSGQAVTLTATVTPGVAGPDVTGDVAFADSGAPLGNATVTGGTATLVVSSLAAGTHALTATYSGDVSYATSQGTLGQTVTAPPAPPTPPSPPVVTVKPPKVRLVASATKVSVGDKIRLQWRSERADSAVASGDWNGAQKTKGSTSLRVTDRGKHVFKLTVQNAAGARTAKVTVVAARKAKALELVVTDGLTLVGSDVEVSADGLAKGEEYTVRLNGKPVLTGRADKRGDVDRTFTLAKATPEGALDLTITGSNPDRVGTAVLNVIAPKTLVVAVGSEQVERRQEQTLTVTGLAAGETVTVTYAGEKLTTGEADKAGSFALTFRVGKVLGNRTVEVVGADPSRSGEATFMVVRAVVPGTGRAAPARP